MSGDEKRGECRLCGGAEEIEATLADGTKDYVGCPACIQERLQSKHDALVAERDELRAALKPMADLYAGYKPMKMRQGVVISNDTGEITFEDCRRAAELLETFAAKAALGDGREGAG